MGEHEGCNLRENQQGGRRIRPASPSNSPTAASTRRTKAGMSSASTWMLESRAGAARRARSTSASTPRRRRTDWTSCWPATTNVCSETTGRGNGGSISSSTCAASSGSLSPTRRTSTSLGPATGRTGRSGWRTPFTTPTGSRRRSVGRNAASLQAASTRAASANRSATRRVDGKLVVDPREKAVLLDAVARLARGASPLRICREWNEAGLRTSRGGRWVPRTLTRTLTGDHITGGKGYPRVLSDEEAAVARARLTSAHRPAGRPAGVAAPLTGGLLRCGLCGTKMTSASGSYRCTGARGGCGNISIKRLPLERWLLVEALRRWLDVGERDARTASGEIVDDTAPLLDELRRLEALEEEMVLPLRMARSRFVRRARRLSGSAHGEPSSPKRSPARCRRR